MRFRHRTFMTPASPDGKKGEVIEVQSTGEQRGAPLAPRPHFANHQVQDGEWVENTTPEQAMSPVEPLDTTGRLSPAEIVSLKKEAADLRARLDAASMQERAKINDRLAKIDAMLKREAAAAEADRVNADRQAERERQQKLGGPDAGREARPLPTSNQQVVNWSAMSMADQTTAIRAAMKELRRIGTA